MSQPNTITISSYNSPENQRASNFESILPNTIVYPKKLCLTKFIMQNYIYDIQLPYNIIYITLNDGTNNFYAQLNVDTGTHWPSGSAFATYLTTNLSAVLQASGAPASSINVSFSTLTAKLTITTTNPAYTFTLNSWTNPILASGALYKLGFTVAYPNVATGYDGVFTSTLTGDGNLNLLGTSVIYVSCSILGNAQNDKKALDGTIVGDDTIIGVIPCNANFGELIIFEDSYGHFNDIDVNSIRSIRINLLNEEYEIIQLPRGVYCTLEFRVQY